ncbi:protein-glutamate methylesterase/protein-glutamine glutaminase [Celeribacter litoreus]|uniref:protein-glutamate methylesterase/protein-glutamine glutaminase n=1 Tax=Celeribacter litoreus TaxID=2876714 RepID=UPI001CC97F6F|nr:chemotaxis response regulator protein-glutamate methylesterase [Celeribacter litoreus]MCA0044965.1 chemotaxis response regulator protein-glutamate methylesterase [Celeribacter litoreus]
MQKRVLIVDDSPTMRRLIRSILSKDPRLEIVAEAGSAHEARDAVNRFRPDVMTLDVEMPEMSGIDFLRRLMAHRPMPVVMVSTLTRKGGEKAVEAFSLGAVDCVEKPRLGQATDAGFTHLADTVVMAANARVAATSRRKPANAPLAHRSFNRICLIGGSTGAVDAIERVLESFPADCPPTLITQHMPETFLVSFAARLDPLVKPRVRLANDGDPLRVGEVLIAPGGAYHLNVEGQTDLRVKLHEAPPMSGHRPSVDSMFLSARAVAHRTVACLLTGMGRDGAQGMRVLRENGAKTVGQSEQTCVVFGMPRVAGELGGVERWSDLNDIGEELLRLCERPAKVGV